jgi:hypothetical protein
MHQKLYILRSVVLLRKTHMQELMQKNVILTLYWVSVKSFSYATDKPHSPYMTDNEEFTTLQTPIWDWHVTRGVTLGTTVPGQSSMHFQVQRNGYELWHEAVPVTWQLYTFKHGREWHTKHTYLNKLTLPQKYEVKQALCYTSSSSSLAEQPLFEP